MIPAEEDFDEYGNVNLPELLETVSLFVFEEIVSLKAARLRGGGGLCGVICQ